jgi:hypothetical protein
MADRAVFKMRHYACRVCNDRRSELKWDYDVMRCCDTDMVETYSARGESAAVHGDEIDELVRHGICNDDGTPRRYRSKTEKREALIRKGLVIDGETPKTQNERNRWF